MKLRSILTLSLLAVILLIGCAPAAPEPAQPEAPVQPAPVENEPTDAPAPTATMLQPEAAPTEALPAETPQAVATSRGPNLEASDPSMVSLSSGDLQLVEFFRFTWSTCRAMAPMVHGLEAQYFGKIKFTYLDADDSRTKGFQRALGFGYQPEFYLLDGNGNLLKKWVGFVSQDEFEMVFAEHLQ